MALPSRRERFAAGLKMNGWERDFTTRASRYWVFTHSQYDTRIYLGRSGAFRVGPTVVGSIPAGAGFIQRQTGLDIPGRD